MDLKLIATLVPAIYEGIKDGLDIIERLQKGDQDAVQLAQDWIGVSQSVETAIADWKASLKP